MFVMDEGGCLRLNSHLSLSHSRTPSPPSIWPPQTLQFRVDFPTLSDIDPQCGIIPEIPEIPHPPPSHLQPYQWLDSQLLFDVRERHRRRACRRSSHYSPACIYRGITRPALPDSFNHSISEIIRWWMQRERERERERERKSGKEWERETKRER